MVSKGYAEANKKLLKSYQAYIVYDILMQLVPFEILDWVNSEKINLGNYCDEVPIGCCFEVDFNYLD